VKAGETWFCVAERFQCKITVRDEIQKVIHSTLHIK